MNSQQEFVLKLFDKILYSKVIKDQNEIDNISKSLKKYNFQEGFDLTYKILLQNEYSSESQFWIYNYLRIIAEQLHLTERISQIKQIIRTGEEYRNSNFDLERVDAVVNISMIKSNGKTRIGPAFSGYRVPLYFNKYGFSTAFKFLDLPIIFPDESSRAEIQLSAPDYFKDSLFINQVFELKEGNRVVASGSILKIVNDSLIK